MQFAGRAELIRRGQRLGFGAGCSLGAHSVFPFGIGKWSGQTSSERMYKLDNGEFADADVGQVLQGAWNLEGGVLAYDFRRAARLGLRREPGVDAAARRALLFASAVLVMLCLVFTHSRASIATALIGLACSSLLMMGAPRDRGRARLIVGALVVADLALAALIGLAPILERFEPAELRLSILQGARRVPVLCREANPLAGQHLVATAQLSLTPDPTLDTEQNREPGEGVVIPHLRCFALTLASLSSSMDGTSLRRRASTLRPARNPD